MKSLSAICIAILMSIPAAWADRGDDDGPDYDRDDLSLYAGSLEVAFTQEGELGDCGEPPPGEFFPRLLVRATYLRLAGVCDDQSSRPCAGRLTRIWERCTADDVVHPIEGGGAAIYSEGRVRICYDESASGHCDEVDEVASGTATSFFGTDVFNNLTDDDPDTFDTSGVGMDREVIRRAKRFRLDGRNVRVRRGVANGTEAGRFNNACLFGPNECPFTGSFLYTR